MKKLRKQAKNKKSLDAKSLYILTDAAKWMGIMSDKEKSHPAFGNYLQLKKRLLRFFKYIEFKKEHNVVDYGCGSGLWGDLIHKKIGTYTGVDFSLPYIDLAKKRQKVRKLANVKFYCADIIEFSKTHQGKYDMAFAFDFSEHLTDKEFIVIFGAIKKTLKKNGKLYIHTPNGDYFLEIFKKWGLMEQPEGHVGIRNFKALKKILKKISFKEVEVVYLPHYVWLLGIFHFLGFFPFIGKFFRARLFVKAS